MNVWEPVSFGCETGSVCLRVQNSFPALLLILFVFEQI